MRLSAPRIEPIGMDEYEARSDGRDRSAVNIGRMWLRYPALKDAHRAMGPHLMGPSATVPVRERELGIMRMGVLRRSDYEFAQHRAFTLEDGVFTEEEIERIVGGPDAPGWTEFEATILRAVDQLHDDAFIDEPTWKALAAGFSTEQIMDFIVLMGRYWMIATMLNTLGVQLEEGKVGLPEGLSEQPGVPAPPSSDPAR